MHYQMGLCNALCEGRLKISPHNPHSRFQLGPREAVPMEDMYLIASHCVLSPQHLSKVRVHALGISHEETEVSSA